MPISLSRSMQGRQSNHKSRQQNHVAMKQQTAYMNIDWVVQRGALHLFLHPPSEIMT
jgi:hypothetical protein